MIDPISMTAAAATTPAPTVPSIGAAYADAERFDRASETARASNAVELSESSAPMNRTIGDVILEGLTRFKSGHDVRADRVAESLEAMKDKPLDMQQAMTLQYEIMQMTLEQDLTSKIADKSSQGVQSLFRNQG